MTEYLELNNSDCWLNISVSALKMFEVKVKMSESYHDSDMIQASNFHEGSTTL